MIVYIFHNAPNHIPTNSVMNWIIQTWICFFIKVPNTVVTCNLILLNITYLSDCHVVSKDIWCQYTHMSLHWFLIILSKVNALFKHPVFNVKIFDIIFYFLYSMASTSSWVITRTNLKSIIHIFCITWISLHKKWTICFITWTVYVLTIPWLK